MKPITLFLFLNLVFTSLYAQEMLTLEQAIEIGMKNNYSIEISKNQAMIPANDVYIGNAGMLPSVTLNAGQNNSVVNSHQVFATGVEQIRNNAKSNALTAGVALNWTLFDGLGMFVTYEKLKQLRDMGELNARLSIENGIASIINSYYGAVMKKQLLKAIQQNMNISSERMKISETRFQIGADSKLTYLQAKVDYNADRSAFLRQQILLENNKISLNQLLGRDINTPFNVIDTILITYTPTIEELKKEIPQNTSLLLADKSIAVSKLSLKEINAQLYPKIGLIANYNLIRSQSQSGLQLSSQTLGPTIGLTATMNLFNGFRLNKTSKDAEISLRTSKLQYNLVKSQLDDSVYTAFNNLGNQLELLKLEQDNIITAKENIDAVMERFRVGSISAFDVKEAQRSFSDAENRLVTVLYQTKVAETSLMRLSGRLVK